MSGNAIKEPTYTTYFTPSFLFESLSARHSVGYRQTDTQVDAQEASGNVTRAPPVAPRLAQQSTLHLTPVPEASPPGAHSPHRTTRKSDTWQHEPQRPPPPAAPPCVPPPSAERDATSDSTWPAPTPCSPCSSPSGTGCNLSPSRGGSGCRNWSPPPSRSSPPSLEPRPGTTRVPQASRSSSPGPSCVSSPCSCWASPSCRARPTFRYRA